MNHVPRGDLIVPEHVRPLTFGKEIMADTSRRNRQLGNAIFEICAIQFNEAQPLVTGSFFTSEGIEVRENPDRKDVEPYRSLQAEVLHETGFGGYCSLIVALTRELDFQGFDQEIKISVHRKNDDPSRLAQWLPQHKQFMALYKTMFRLGFDQNVRPSGISQKDIDDYLERGLRSRSVAVA